ncbi:efflux transporter outer membrane subunit [Pseudorhodoferax sp. Leaf274]|uniref:efflux transporter outer membrane subunit n=1 Tax=Pseudorhodoferax sp. Leaf274 TaxID=1736318 RepID=UPI0007028C32|nr:efflux transporter outer membrane subunit [Pseudorhodoferax sp. Leaf274]KQP38107.1 multidrug transporter [Pseudorhodoferax sp. Leaf274]
MTKKPSARLSALALAALTALMAGCSFMPTYERPAAPVAAQWPGEASATPAAQPVADIPWQSFFSDARLRALVEQALANNRDLRVAVLNIEQARAQYRIQRADRLPSIGVGASGSRTPQGNGENLTAYQVGLTLSSWELDFFGRIASLSEAALAQYLATEEGRKSTQITLVASVANAYLSLLADDELLELTRQTLATREDSAKLSKLRFDSGVASELDLRQAQSLLEAARATLAQLQRQRAQDQNQLTLLVGQPDWAQRIAALPATSRLESAVMMNELPAGLPSDVLTARPDIRQAEQQLRSANANIGAARAAFFPRITLTAGFGTVSGQLSGLFEGGSWGWSVAPQLLLPIFDGGRNQAGLDSANVSRDIAVAQYEKAIQTAFREVADALAGRATLGEELRAQQAQAEAESARFKLSDLRYRNGVASYLDLLDAQRSLFVTQQAVVQTRLAQLQNQVTLYRTLGGGWTQQP